MIYPEKIYLDSEYNTNEWPKQAFPNKTLQTDVEYIRKDVVDEILKKYCEQIKNN